MKIQFFRPFLAFVVLTAVLLSPVAGLFLEMFNQDKKTMIKLESVYKMTDGWEYQWEDSETGSITDSGWRSSPSLVNPPGRSNRNILWLRTKMPDNEVFSPAILIDGKGILLTFELFINHRKIYQFGRLDPSGQGDFAGISSHLIPIKNDFPGKMLYLRIFSDYTNIGVRGNIFLGSKSALVQKIVRNDILYFVVALFIISIGILDLAIYKNSVLTIGSISMYGLFAMGLGFYAINTTTLKDLIFFAPQFWLVTYVAGVSLIPVGLTGFLWQVFRPAYGNFYHRTWQFQLGYSYLCQAMAVLLIKGWISFKACIVALTILRILLACELVLMTAVCIHDTVWKKDRLAGMYLLGFFPVLLTGIHSILVGLGILKSPYSYVPLALIVFLLSLEIVQRWQNIIMQKKLQAYAGELEMKSNEKLELIKDLHDGIGGTITNMKFISEMGLQNHSGQEMKKSLLAISEMSGNCMTEISNFMQSLDENEVSWDSLVQKMSRLGETKLTPLGTSVHFKKNIEPQMKAPGSLLFLNILRIFQEALTNIVKHAKAKNVFITIDITYAKISMIIQDDGIGFREGVKPKGRGLANMNARVRKLNGNFSVESENGVCIKVELQNR